MDAGQQFDTFFDGHPTRHVPWPMAGRSKSRPRYADDTVVSHEVGEYLKGNRQLTPVDTNALHATQPSVTRAGVKHYLEGSTNLHADEHKPGNQVPVVYKRADNGQLALLGGHHRAVAAHLKGEPLQALHIEGP